VVIHEAKRPAGWMALSAALQTIRGEMAQQRNPDAGPAQAR
jgi:hypothetical protein